jgi:hypothetical protein
MGVCSSVENTYYTEDDYIEIAYNNFNRRIHSYSYAHHGDYIAYVTHCRQLYELECLHPVCRYGSNYKQRYDSWGNKI